MTQPPYSPAPYPQQPYGQAPQSQPPARNPLGLASLIVGAVGPVLGLVFLLVQASLVARGEIAALGAVSTVNGALAGLAAVVALVLGLVALTRRGRSKVLAAAGIALGASGLVGVLGSVLYGIVVSAFRVYD